MSHDIRQPDLPSLLRLQALGDGSHLSVSNERNGNGRVYGGQLIAQILVAAMAEAPAGRRPTVLQMVFLQGPQAALPIDYRATALQDGSRFSSRHVRAVQAGRSVADAHVSFQTVNDGPEHQDSPPSWVTTPDTLLPIGALDPRLRERLRDGGYGGGEPHPFIDFRLVDPQQRLFPDSAGQSFVLWFRVARPMPDDPGLHAAALAYLSDWWTTYPSLAPHMPRSGGSGYYVASLNHSLWFHAPCRADAWLLCVARSPRANGARGLNTADIYTREGLMVASVAQQCLLAPRHPEELSIHRQG
jgi:acyl-CoA thioesterase-2